MENVDSIFQNLSKLLAPISEEKPAGENLRFDESFRLIKEERHEDLELPRGEWETPLKTANWSEVKRLSEEFLETRSKDLQVAAWMLESLIKLHGFHGVHQGIKLISHLCKNFWEGIHPEIQGGEVELRLSPLLWIDKKLSSSLKQIPITEAKNDDQPIFSLQDWEITRNPRPVSVENIIYSEDEIQEPTITKEMVLEAVNHSPIPFYQELQEKLEKIIKEVQELEDFLESKCEELDSFPIFSDFIKTLKIVQNHVNDTLAKRLSEVPELGSQELSTGSTDTEDTTTTETEKIPTSSNSPYTREMAYQELDKIADFLLKIEPHSPTPYLVKRAVSWGKMPLPALLAELLQNHDINQVYALLGIPNAMEA